MRSDILRSADVLRIADFTSFSLLWTLLAEADVTGKITAIFSSFANDNCVRILDSSYYFRRIPMPFSEFSKLSLSDFHFVQLDCVAQSMALIPSGYTHQQTIEQFRWTFETTSCWRWTVSATPSIMTLFLSAKRTLIRDVVSVSNVLVSRRSRDVF